MARVSVKVFSILCGVVGGWASALSFIDSVGSKPAGTSGNWRVWDLASGTSSNPYGRAHFLFDGRVPPAQSLFQVYTSTRDDEGSTLRSNCVYKIAAGDLAARWWSLSAGPLDNPDKDSPVVLTSEDVVRNPDRSISVAMSRYPVAGNWLRPAVDGSIVIQLVVSNAATLQEEESLKLPAIQRVSC